MQFPVYKTKRANLTGIFDLNDPVSRHEYFHAKVEKEIEEIKQYLETNTFVAFLLAKKSAGKGTYAKLLEEIFGADRIAHLSVGDLVRSLEKKMRDPNEKKEILDYLMKHYRGFISLEEAVDAFEGRNTTTLIPTEFILTLVRREIEALGNKAVLIDGFPRNLDQVSYSLYFRQIMSLRDDPDFFVLIDVPESIIDKRMKGRVVCPTCQTSRNIYAFPTKFVKYLKDQDRFVLLCDNKECKGYESAIMVGKEGDELGIEAIRERINTEGSLMERAMSLHGVQSILVRNAIPTDKAADLVDDYELTPGYSYTYDEASDKASIVEEPWIVADDHGIESYSLLAASAALSLIVQLHEILLGSELRPSDDFVTV